VILFPPDVGVAIVSHNGGQVIGAALASLDAAGCPRSAVQVIDVASTDGTVEFVTRTYPGVQVERLERNDGPNPGRNLAIRSCPHPYIFLMDVDVEVRPQTIQLLRAAIEGRPRAKIGSPIVLYARTPETIQYAGGSLHFICEAINPWLDRPLVARGLQPKTIGVAPACGLLIDKAAAIGIGLFDERYFMGKDDGDFTYRTRVAGYDILEVPAACVLHRSRPRGVNLFSYQIRNRWHFMLKNYQWSTLLLISPCLVVHEALQAVLLHATGYGRAYWTAVAGLLKMLPSLPRDRRLVGSFRAIDDAALLQSDRLMVRDDLLTTAFARAGRNAYELFLRGYWRLLTRTVLARAASAELQTR
jgi:GT2 family glycosyltransferase